MRIAIKYVNGKPYFDKTFLERFGEDNLTLYGYTTCEVPEECFDDFTSDDFVGLFFNKNKYNQRKLKELNKASIENYKKLLASTDYQAIKHSEGVMTDEEYDPIKAQRQEWRDEINRLEAEND